MLTTEWCRPDLPLPLAKDLMAVLLARLKKTAWAIVATDSPTHPNHPMAGGGGGGGPGGAGRRRRALDTADQATVGWVLVVLVEWCEGAGAARVTMRRRQWA